MKFSILATVALISTAFAADDPSAVLSSYYDTPPTVTGSTLTALASAIAAVKSSWENSPAYTSVNEAIISAAPSNVQASLTASRWRYNSLTGQDWWTKVPDSAKKALSSEQAAAQSAENKVLGTATGVSTGAAPRMTGLVAGAVGVLGAVGVVVGL